MEDNLYVSSLVDTPKHLLVQWLTQNKSKQQYPLNNGPTVSNRTKLFTSGDGVALFSTAHPLVSGGTNSNRPVQALT